MGNSEKIIYYLRQRKDWVKASELADYLSISERQVRKYISAINSKEEIVASGPQGYLVDHKRYDAFIALQSHSITEQESRQKYIIQKLLSHSQGYDLFDLADALFVSETTIKKDLSAIKRHIAKYKMTIIRSRNRIRLSGSEEQLRKLMYELISGYPFHTSFFQEGFRLFGIHYDYSEIQSKLKEAMQRCHLACNDFALSNLIVHLIIILNRAENGYQLPDQAENKDAQATDSYQAALLINEYFAEEYGILLNISELWNIALLIDNNISRAGQINYDNLNLRNIHKYVDEKYIAISEELIQKVEENYYLPPFKEHFIAKFILHIQNLFFRSRGKYSIKNPLADTIKLTYPLIYDMAVFIAQELKQKYDIFLNEDEIAFISFHIGSYFEGNSFAELTRVSCIFLYTDYYDFHKAVLARIRKRFEDKIALIGAASISDYQEEQKADLLIVPAGTENRFQTRSVYVKPFLDEEDFDRLERAIDELTFLKQREELKDYILNFFHERLFYKDPPFADKEDALCQMCRDLHQQGYTDAAFYHDVVSREALSSTAFHDIAVPHSLTAASTRKSFISIALFTEGMDWSDKKVVHIVALIGVNDHSRKIFSQFFDQLIHMFDDPANIKQLLYANDFDAFFHVISSFFSAEQ